MESRKLHEDRMERKLQGWGAQLDGLAARSKMVGSEMTADEREIIAELRAKRTRAQTRLDELKGSGREGWDTVKTGVESACGDLEATFKKLRR